MDAPVPQIDTTLILVAVMTIPQIDWPHIAVVAQTFLTPVIGLATIVLGVATFLIQRRQTRIQQQQAETNAFQFRLALFERRIKVFDSTMDVLEAIVLREGAEFDQLFDLLRKTREDEFLFGPEINTFINGVYNQGVELNLRRAVAAGGETDLNQEAESLTWFGGRIHEAKKIFLPYIDFRKP